MNLKGFDLHFLAQYQALATSGELFFAVISCKFSIHTIKKCLSKSNIEHRKTPYLQHQYALIKPVVGYLQKRKYKQFSFYDLGW